MLKSPVYFFSILFLLLCVHPVFGQFSGGIADGHSNIRRTNVVCVVINTNPFQGGSGDGVANIRNVNVTCTVVNSNPFLGGSGNGSAFAGVTNITCTTVNANPFLGGAGDGHSDLLLTNVVCTTINANPFLGGIGDGHSDTSLINVTCTLVNTNPFLGGIGDGHSNGRITYVTCIPVNVNPFLGGIADGHAMASVQNVTCVPVNVNPFIGGFADGHANMRLVNVSCTVVNVNPFAGGVGSGHNFKSLTNILCGVSSLPIQLIFFNAKPDGDQVLLSWETASEINNDHFTVERANGNLSFEKVLTMNGNGNTNHFSFYEAKDENPFSGVSYYRLKQTDYDGLYSYSQTEEVNIIRTTTTHIAPNPVSANEEVTLSYESASDERIVIRVRDALGVAACVFVKPVLKGENKFQIKLPELTNGIYFVDIASATKTETLKLMVN